jgi:hypothetical protein
VSSYHEPSYSQHPCEILEPDDTADVIHDSQMALVHLLNNFVAELEQTMSRRSATLRDVKAKLYGMAFGLGLAMIEGKSQTSVAASLGMTRAALSKIGIHFCLANNLGASFYQKSEWARDRYRDARLNSVCRSRAKPFKQPPPLPP